MPKLEAKKVIIDELKSKLEGAASIVLVDARGINVAQDTLLRKSLRESNLEYKVYKNSIIKYAIEGTEFEGISDELKGPTAICIAYEDPTAGAAILAKSAKTVPAIEFKAGVIEGVVYNAEGIKAIASIPPREVLLSKLFGSFKAPIGSFARVIKAVADQKDGDAA
ncbi:MAG: 50S ribosomal protein L10 [Lachnospirales bacterium]